MTNDEALAVVDYLQHAYPTTPWSEGTVLVWVNELLPLGAGQGQAAAMQMVRTQDFPTVARFHAELAQVLERHADEHLRDLPPVKALGPGEGRWLEDEENRRAFAEVRGLLAASAARSRRALAPDPDRPRLPRPDEDYFYPPEPEPEPEPQEVQE